MTARNLPPLGLIVYDPDSVFQRDVIAGMRQIAAARGYQVRIGAVTDTPNTITMLSDALGMEFTQLHGVLVLANIVPDPLLRDMYDTRVPISLVSHQSPVLPIPAVMPDNPQGIQVLMRHLVMTCRRTKPVFIQGHRSQSDAMQREQAFRTELMRYNLALSEAYLIQGDFDPATAAVSMNEFMAAGLPFDAVLAADFQMGVAALQVLRTHDCAVPEDIAVAAFGDGPEAAAAGLTTVAADVVDLGRRATRQLIGQVEGLRIRGLTLLSTELITRKTTAAVS